MLAYTGIGSRTITKEEENTIKEIVNYLNEEGLICYSGNAHGADVAFQRASNGQCVVFLPWSDFNERVFDTHDPKLALDSYDMGASTIGAKCTAMYHPKPDKLTQASCKFMNRNAHQIYGHGKYKPVEFVICCADEDLKSNVLGGTGQACRIAIANHIPVFNIRTDDSVLSQIKDYLNLKSL